MRSLVVAAAPELAFRFEALPDVLMSEIASYLQYLERPRSLPREDALLISTAPPQPGARSEARVILEESGLIVRLSGTVTVFEMEGILGWCDRATGRGGIVATHTSATSIRIFVGLTLAPLMIELAESLGWLGVHAAAVAVEKVGILLPGPSGAGKSTTFRNCYQDGFEVLSDDLVWLKEADDGVFQMFPFPRGGRATETEDTVPPPSISSAEAKSIVCPEISNQDSSRLLSTSPIEVVDVLVSQGGFLGAMTSAGSRFRALVRLADSAPCRRLQAGRNPQDVPPLLRRHVAAITSAAG